MSAKRTTITRRALRRAFSPTVADVIEAHQLRIQRHADILNRGFWGRVKWLLFGK